MKIENIEKKENTALGREELTAQVFFSEATPSRSDVIKAVAATTKSKENLVVVRKLQGNYGGGSATLTAHIYKERETLENVEREYMRTRNTVKEEPAEEKSEAKAEEPAEEKAPTEEAKAETPAEEKTEEAKTESKEPAEDAAAKEPEKPVEDSKEKAEEPAEEAKKPVEEPKAESEEKTEEPKEGQ